MTELEPFSESCDDFERALLRSTRTDQPPVGAAAKTLIVLGLAPNSAVAAAGLGGAAGGARSLTVWSIFKGLAVGMLAGGAMMAVGGGLTQGPNALQPGARSTPVADDARSPPRHLVPSDTSPAEPSVTIAAPASSTADHVTSAAKASQAVSRSEEARVAANPNPAAYLPLPVAPQPSAVAAFAAQPSAAPTLPHPSSVSIAEQVDVIERARGALKNGHASDALVLSNNYARRWPNGSLAIEAVVVRIEAELALGQRGAAERDARAVMKELPGSRYAARVSQLFSPPLAE